MVDAGELLERGVRERNRVTLDFFDREAGRLADVCLAMAQRFARGGRVLAFGTGNAATDAQHVAVEFVHPVIVGKRSLPAWDVSPVRDAGSVARAIRPSDILMGFAAPNGDAHTDVVLAEARQRGALTMALPGTNGDYAIPAPHPDPFITQEVIEILYHVLWETVHVFLEYDGSTHDAGAAAFLYPFLDAAKGRPESLLGNVADSIQSKARANAALREATLQTERDILIAATRGIRERLRTGGRLLLLGNGGSATDANDWALDCVASPKGGHPVPAMSLAGDAALLTAFANDIGVDAMFSRQIIALGTPGDVVIALSTSGGSANVIAALEEARRRGLLTVALVGYSGGEVARRGLADFPICVRSDYIPRIQEIHATMYHLMVDLLAEAC